MRRDATRTHRRRAHSRIYRQWTCGRRIHSPRPDRKSCFSDMPTEADYGKNAQERFTIDFFTIYQFKLSSICKPVSSPFVVGRWDFGPARLGSRGLGPRQQTRRNRTSAKSLSCHLWPPSQIASGIAKSSIIIIQLYYNYNLYYTSTDNTAVSSHTG